MLRFLQCVGSFSFKVDAVPCFPGYKADHWFFIGIYSWAENFYVWIGYILIKVIHSTKHSWILYLQWIPWIELKGLFATRLRWVTLSISVLSINNYFSLITISYQWMQRHCCERSSVPSLCWYWSINTATGKSDNIFSMKIPQIHPKTFIQTPTQHSQQKFGHTKNGV